MSNQLNGTWELESAEIQLPDGGKLYPFGEQSEGHLVLDGEQLSAQLMRCGRPRFESDELFQGSDEEISAAYSGYLAFWGPYTVDEANGTIRYLVRGCVFPNWIGLAQDRGFSLSGDALTLTTAPVKVGGLELPALMIWRRVR